MPCCKCKSDINILGSQVEAFCIQKPLRLKRCGADIHEHCRKSLLSPMEVLRNCPIRSCGLGLDGSLDGYCSPGDVFNGQKPKL